MTDGGIQARKVKHLEACLYGPVEFQTIRTGFADLTLPYRALPETDLGSVELTTSFHGRSLQAPLLIGAMTGGAELAATINRNLAAAAEELGLGLMLGSQRIMLEYPELAASFQVREHAPNALLIGNPGIAQLNRGYGATEVDRAAEMINADAMALHANPLQEAMQADGDTDFRGLLGRLGDLVENATCPVMLKEVGHGLGREVVTALDGVPLSAIDVAGAGGTSWARVEQYVRHGEIIHPDLVEWGIPTATALAQVRAARPEVPAVASGGIRSGLDIAKALAMGASAVAIARPLLAPAIESPEAVVDVLADLLGQLRAVMYCAGVTDIASLAQVSLSRGTHHV